MFYFLFNWFAKITGWIIQFFCFRTKIYYENENASRYIKGRAILIANHTSIFDYPVAMFVFFTRTLRVQMAELLFKKPFVGILVRLLGGIYVDRYSNNLSFMSKSQDILNKGGVVGIWPEGRVPKKDEERPLEFKTGAAYLALSTDSPIIPFYTNGSYFDLRHRAEVVIGEPIYPFDIADSSKTDKENIEALTRVMREKIIDLGNELNAKHQKA